MITSLCPLYYAKHYKWETEHFCFCPVPLFLQPVSDYKRSYSLNLYEASVSINLQINVFLALHAEYFLKSLYIKKTFRMTVGYGCTIFHSCYNYHHRYRFKLLHYSLLFQPTAQEQAIRILMLHIFYKLSTVLYGFDLFNIP